MPEYSLNIRQDWSQAEAARRAYVQGVQADIQRLEQRAAASGSRRGQPQALGASQRTAEGELYRAVGAGELSRRAAVEIRREIRQLYQGVSDSIRQMQADVASAAAGATRRRPGSRGGDAALIGSAPTNAEIDNLEKLLRDRDALQERITRSAQAAGMQREYGLRAGRAEEAEFRRLQNQPGYGGDETPLELRSSLSHDRRRREVDETLATQRLINADKDLTEQQGALANEYRRRTLAERRASRRQLTDSDRQGEVREAVDAGTRGQEIRRQARAAMLLRRAMDEEVEVQEAILANAKRRLDLNQKATRRRLSGPSDLAAEAAELRASRERRYAVQALAGDPPPQGFIDRILASTRPQPGQRQTPFQFLAGKAITTGSFALSGGLLYGGVRVIGDMVRQAEELQRLFSLIEAQFDAIGQPGQFSGFRQEVLEIARTTGVAADEVATVAFQMRGAFEPTEKAIHETAAAIRVSLVTGIEQKELTDSLTAASIAYGVSIEDIGDKAIGLEERFGVLSRESLKVFGDMASTAKEVGFSLDEMGAIVGVIQQRSGRGGAAIAEGLGRVLPALGDSAVEIARLYELVPALQESAGGVMSALAGGRTGDVLLQLLRDIPNLDQATRAYIITLLGGRREAQLLIPLFAGAADVIKEVDRTQTDAGKTSERFAALQQTLAQRVARFREEVMQLGDALFRAGLVDAMEAGVEVGSIFVGTLGAVLRVLAGINDATSGAVGKFALYVGAINLAAAAFRGLRGAAAGAAVAQAAAQLTGTGGPGMLGRIAAFPGGLARGRLAAAGTGATNAGFRAAAGGAGRIGQTLSYGTGGALGLLGISPHVVIGASVAAVGVAAYKQHQEINRIGDEVAAQLETLSLDRLEELLAQTEEGFWEKVGAALLGGDTGRDLIEQEIRQKTPENNDVGQSLQAYLDAYGAGDIREAAGKSGPLRVYANDLPGMIEKINSGDEAAIAAGRLILEDIETNHPQYAKRLENALKIKRENDRRKRAQDAAAANAPTFEGTIQSIEQVKAAFEAGEVGFPELIAVQRDEVRIMETLTNNEPEKLKQLLEARRALAKSEADAVAGMIPILAQFRTLQGGPAAGGIADILNALAAKVPGTRTYQDAGEAIPDISAIRDPRQRAQLAGEAANLQADAFRSAIGDESSAAAALAKGRAGVRLDPRVRAELEASLSAIYGTAISVPEVIKLTEDEIKDLEAKVIQERIGKINLEAARSNDDVVKAEAGVKAAKLALEADLTDAERDAALISLIQAENELEQVLADRAAAAAELVIARLQAKGDDVGAARERVNEARRLAGALPADASQAERDRLDAAVVTAEANARDTEFADKQRSIDVALQLERITTAQAIAQLEALLAFPNITQQQTEDLLIKIKQLRDQANSDFQFNLGEIRLPTLYEVRRLNASTTPTGGYVDQKQVNVVFHNYNATDYQGAIDQFAQVVDAPPRLGTEPRGY